MTDLVKINSYLARSKDFLISQFKDKPNLLKILTIKATQLDELETVLFQFINETSLDDAIGDLLDVWGEILGEDRAGRPDEEYRTALKIRISINNSSGQPETLIEVFKALTEADKITYSELYPCAIVMASDGITIPTNLLDSMYKITAGGVSLYLVITGTTPFKYDEGLGFGSIHDSELGGLYSHGVF